MKYRITVGESRLDRTIKRRAVYWAKLARRLQKYSVIEHNYADYMAMPPDQQTSLKDNGWFIGGRFQGQRRVAQEMIARSCITLDLDHLDPWDVETVREVYSDFEYLCHSTAKHDEDSPRLRIVFPLREECSVETYEPIARRVASIFDMDAFDDTCFQPARAMFWPSVCQDRDPVYWHNTGRFVDPRAVEATYTDVLDCESWPGSSRIDQIRKPVAAAEWPLDKPGVIGAFCRTFDIHAAIQEFDLPYQHTANENRYSPDGATGAAGAIVYDDVFLYSHHESDVARQRNLNAFDLVRLHRFAELVAKENDDMPMSERESYRAMVQLAASISEVVREIQAGTDEEIREITNTNSEDPKPAVPVLTYNNLRQEIDGIADNDDRETACVAMIAKIAAARLSFTENSRLAGFLRGVYPDPKPTRKDIEKDIKNFSKRLSGAASAGAIADAEHQIIQHWLDEQYEGGKTLKRFAKCYWTHEKGLWGMCDDERIDGKLWNYIVGIRSERPQDMPELVAAIDDRSTSSWLFSLAKALKGFLAEREDRDDPLQLLRRFPLPVVNTLNCEICFDVNGNFECREHDPDNFLTTQVACDYEPDAECPEWDRFCALIFSECFDPEDMQRHLEELGGYAISNSRWLKTWVLLKGPKDTGKSTFTEVLISMLGSAALSQDLGRFGERANQFTNTGLVGKLILVDDDFAKRSVLPDGFLKTISEEKSLSTEKKYGDVFRFICRALPLICSNHWPKTSDLSDAIRERAVVFPFSHKIAGHERSDQRRAAMLEELPGILNRFLAGLSRLRERGDWDHPLECIEAREEWTRHSNIVGLFAHERIRGKSGATLLGKDAWQAFQAFRREESGSDRHHMGRDTFYSHLDSLIGKRGKIGGNQLAYPNVELVSQPFTNEIENF